LSQKDIQGYTEYGSCQQLKPQRQKPQGVLPPSQIPDRWAIISKDFITGLPKTDKGYDSVPVITDRLSKIVHIEAVRIPMTA
jgi:hypothetical protein